VGKVDCFSLAGLDIYFNSSDHRPPHFHVGCADWEIRVFIDTTSVESGLSFNYKYPRNPSKNFMGITSKQKKELLGLVVNHRAQLLQEWQQKVNIGELI
jgi:hypothetical protein